MCPALVGPKSGTASHTLAERVPGSGMTALRANADTVGGAMSRAKMVCNVTCVLIVKDRHRGKDFLFHARQPHFSKIEDQ